jgi:hypothetical protein
MKRLRRWAKALDAPYLTIDGDAKTKIALFEADFRPLPVAA